MTRSIVLLSRAEAAAILSQLRPLAEKAAAQYKARTGCSDAVAAGYATGRLMALVARYETANGVMLPRG